MKNHLKSPFEHMLQGLAYWLAYKSETLKYHIMEHASYGTTHSTCSTEHWIANDIKVNNSKTTTMKKIIFGLFALMAMVSLVACNRFTEAKISKAIEQGDFETAHQYLDEMHSKFTSTDDFYTYSMGDTYITKQYKNYLSTMEKLYCAEIKDLLLNDSEKAIKAIPFFLSEIPVDGIGDPTISRAAISNLKKSEEAYLKRAIYIESVNTYNNICMYALKQSINTGNNELAMNILSFFKDGLSLGEEKHERYYFSKNFYAKIDAYKYYAQQTGTSINLDELVESWY